MYILNLPIPFIHPGPKIDLVCMGVGVNVLHNNMNKPIPILYQIIH